MVVPRPHLRISRNLIEPDPNNPRTHPGDLTALVESLKANGQQVPCLVQQIEKGRYRLVDGWRRWLALGVAGIDIVNVVVLEDGIDKHRLQLIKLTLGVTNAHLNPYEIADGAQALMRETGKTQEEVAKEIGVSPATLSKAFSVMKHLAEQLKPDVETGVLGFTYAATLAQLKDNLPEQIKLAALVKEGKLSRDALVNRVKALLGKKKPKAVPVEFRIANATATTTSEDAEAVIASFTAFINAIRAAQKAGIQNPVRNAPQFIKP